MHRLSLACPLLLLLTACSGSHSAPGDEASATPALPLDHATPIPGPDTAQRAILDTHDCRTIAQGYAHAIDGRDFTFAARFWNDPVIGTETLRIAYRHYAQPRVTIDTVREEGAAGSFYCTAKATLSDAGNPATGPRHGEVVFRRVDTIPGATAAQQRWHIEHSTLATRLDRSLTG